MEKAVGPEPVTRNTYRLALFASGAGSNVLKIIEFFGNPKSIESTRVEIALIVSNNPAAGVVTIARNYRIPLLLVEKKRFLEGDAYPNELSPHHIDLIVLAGFLWKIPEPLLRAFPGKIVNIHPALLPRFGGKGMYGLHVHRAVIESGEKKSGISIHEVDEHYDHGQLLFQAECAVEAGETPESLAEKIHGLEHLHYAPVIARLLESGIAGTSERR